MTASLFELAAGSAPHRWRLPVTPDISVGATGRRFLFGGVGVAAAVAAVEKTLDQPVICAAAQFLSFARAPAVLELEVEVGVRGRQSSQVTVTGAVDGTRVFVVSAATGSRPGEDELQWALRPDMPPPQVCEPAVLWADQTGSLTSRIEFRMARGLYGEGPRSGRPLADGRMVAWLRPRDGGPIQAGDLPVFADYLPSAVGVVLSRERTGGNSLDNIIRFHRIVPTRWALCSARILSVSGALAHGEMQIFSDDGVLMASASQSMIVRTLEPAV